jgi:hypothetical protein
LLPRALVPLVLISILAGCGSSGRPKGTAAQGIRGDGFTVEAPEDWRVANRGSSVVARRGSALVSVTRFRLLKAYDPARFEAAARELDRIVTKLASQSRGAVTERTTTTVDGAPTRTYRYRSGGVETRIGFVLRGKREFQLLCRLPAGGADPDGACRLLFTSFSAR